MAHGLCYFHGFQPRPGSLLVFRLCRDTCMQTSSVSSCVGCIASGSVIKYPRLTHRKTSSRVPPGWAWLSLVPGFPSIILSLFAASRCTKRNMKISANAHATATNPWRPRSGMIVRFLRRRQDRPSDQPVYWQNRILAPLIALPQLPQRGCRAKSCRLKSANDPKALL